MIKAVVGILKRNQTLLVAQRPEGKPYSGYWEFPGGKVEPNEPSQKALARELHEELGIEIITAHPWFEHVHAYPDKTIILELWLVENFLGEPQGKENQALRWVTMNEMLSLNLLEGNIPLIDKIKSLF